ncbi:arginine/serine-rich coiled-coil protein 2 isoform X2 [Amborella trichopoda]|uniref:Small acidic protein-like domain-containing protein n=1 Tax=Amborella trichopoda TaxID=13333 RepID=W1NTH6_AMBTC|nr:arginine/serine-rich coiled-coil protein 2 isoform X2 [Amborella trichopoda]ERN00787.1 hypothetical protein AMTR_s00106p00155270 [Amborella trichopoda]|eukprot:XP_006838218.1 arginine/serine-rich coiled-coil protein 2 isoform X2 [Amborella trichopoda]
MDSGLVSYSPDPVEPKPSFRKPSNDAFQRKYRKRSPTSGSASPLSSGSPQHSHSYSPNISMEEAGKVTNDQRTRMDEEREVERDSSHHRSGKGSDSYGKGSDVYGDNDRHSRGITQGYRRHDDSSKHQSQHRREVEERSSQRYSSRITRDLEGSSHAEYEKRDRDSDNFRDNRRNPDKPPRDRKIDDEGRRKERDSATQGRYRDIDKPANTNMEREKMGERERYRDRGEGRDDYRDYRKSLGDTRRDRVSSYEGSRGYARDSASGRDSGSRHSREIHRSSNRESERHIEDKVQRRRGDDESDRYKNKDSYNRESDDHSRGYSRSSSDYRDRSFRNGRSEDKNVHAVDDEASVGKKCKLFDADKSSGDATDRHLPSKSSTCVADDKSSLSLKQLQEPVPKETLEPVQSSANEAKIAQDLNAAKVAAMKAAGIVNRNLVGGSYLSTDEKKKLLWGNKKTSAAEESGTRWDTAMFSDRERQEKFNKLMGVKGDVKPPAEGTRGDEERQREVQLDLEKQYTAGLRRRDGRTVGLGL